MKSTRILLAGICVIATVATLAPDAMAQSSRRSRASSARITLGTVQPPRRLIDAPTAGTLQKGTFDTELRAYPDGGMLGILQIGLSDRWTIGLGYGGTNIIASRDPEWNPRMNFLTKLQLIDETLALPAVAVGFEEQGFGRWVDSLDRYQNKGKGFYAVASKGYRMGTVISTIHAGLNLSPDANDDDNDINAFFGADLRFPNNFGLAVDYDLALDDDRTPLALGRGYGYLNVGARWMVLNRIFMEINLKDLFSNRRGRDAIGRELRIIYVEGF